jgi:alpha-tubulin suppressor-like RCC1 family protein
VFRAQATPQRVASPLFQSLAVGSSTTCGISLEGDAYCWEANVLGTIGDSTAAGSLAPRAVKGEARFVSISAGGSQTCGVADTGFGYCWGDDSFGQLGVSPVLVHSRCGPQPVPCSTSPRRVTGWRVFSQITAGQGTHACGLTLKANIYCWGSGGLGQRGDGRSSFGEWSPVKTRSP